MFSMIQFQSAGLVIVLFIMCMHFARRTKWLVTERTFEVFLFIVLAGLLLDISSIFAIAYRTKIPVIVTNLISKFYLISLQVTTLMTLVYLFADLFWYEERIRKLFRPFLIFLIVIFCSYLFLPIYYFFDFENRVVYSYGPAVFMTYACCLSFLALSFGILIFCWDKISLSRKLPVVVIISSFIISAVIQFFNNELLLVGFAMSMAVMVIYLYMENPYLRMDRELGTNNEHAWNLYVKQMFARKKDFNMVAIYINDLESIIDIFGNKNKIDLLLSITNFFRSIDDSISFRMGTNNFIVVSSTLKNKDLLEKITRRFAEPFSVADASIKLSVSYCTYPDSKLFSDVQELISIKNYIHLKMKRNANETFITVNEDLIKSQREMVNIKKRLQWALENDGFDVFYQPIYSFEKGRIVSAEALTRLKDEEGKFINPEVFIQIAEENGMILEIGMKVFDKVCRFIKDFHPEDLGIEYIEVNLSVVQCMQETLAGDLMAIMDKYKINPGFINFEITETSMINSKDVLLNNMSELIENSANFYLDDYGSGYSNLSYIIGLPLHAVKLDKSIVWASFTSEKGSITLEFVVRMIKNLNMKIVAEGIENKEQFNKMKELGVDLVQGYYFSRPVDSKDFVKFMFEYKDDKD